jgi:hypothetical protein
MEMRIVMWDGRPEVALHVEGDTDRLVLRVLDTHSNKVASWASVEVWQ